MRWEDDGLLCPHCEHVLVPRCLCWQSGDDEDWDDRTEDVEGGRAMSHARPDDDEWESD